MRSWRAKNLDTEMDSKIEEPCKSALKTLFSKVVVSNWYQIHIVKTTREDIATIRIGMEHLTNTIGAVAAHQKPGHPHMLTASVPQVNCWFREEELQDIKSKLTSHQNLMLVNGFGGIGKSTVARQLFHEIHAGYTFAGWVPYVGNLKSSLLQSFRDAEGLPWAGVEDMAQRTRSLWNFLQDSGEKTLLIIDNVEQDESADPDLDELTGMEHLTVILTSRLDEIAAYEPFPIGFMSKEDSVELFIKYYKLTGRKYQQYDRETVEKLVELVQYHTFSVELLAKSAKREPNLRHFYQQMKELKIQYPKRSVKAGSENARRTMAEHLKKLFDWTERSEEESRVLQNIALMPSVTIPVELADWIECEEDTLDALAESGWLMFQAENDHAGYYMHPLVKDVLWLDRTKFPESIGAEFMVCLWKGNYIKHEKETYVTALPKLEIADSVLDGIGVQRTEAYVRTCYDLAVLFRVFSKYSKAQQYSEQAKEMGEAVFSENDARLVVIYNNLALLYRDQSRYNQAEKYYLKALAIHESVLGNDHPDTATTYNNLAVLYQDQDRYSQAEEYYLKALAIRESVLGNDHPETATTYGNLANLYRIQGNYSAAEHYFLKTLHIIEIVLGNDHPDTATTYNNLAIFYQDQGRYSQAEEHFLKALAIVKTVQGKDHLNTATTYGNLANLYQTQGNYSAAEHYFLNALSIYEKVLGINHVYTATTYSALGAVYGKQKKQIKHWTSSF